MLALSIFLSLSFVWEYYQFAYIMCGGGVSYLHSNNEGFIILAFIIYLKELFYINNSARFYHCSIQHSTYNSN